MSWETQSSGIAEVAEAKDGTSIDAPHTRVKGATNRGASISSEARWMRQVARGDRDAFSDLYDRYANTLYALALGILNDANAAEHVLHDVFLQIWATAASFDEARETPFCWMTIQTRGKALECLRSKKALVEEPVSTIPPMIKNSAPKKSSPRHAQAAHMRALMSAMPDEQRLAIEMALLGGRRCGEIAVALQQPAGAIRAHIHQGMLRVRDVMRDTA